MTIFVIIILLLAYVFSSSFRKIFEWIYYELAAFWLSHRTWFVIIFLALWLIPTISLLFAGSYANAFPSAVVFVLLFPVWIILSVTNGLKNLSGSIQNPGTTVIRSSRGFISVFISAVLIIAVVNIAIGLWSPEFKDAFDERHGDVKVAAENSLRRGHVQSERNAGVRGRVKTATGVYDDFNKPILGIIPAGKIIMVLSLQSKPATRYREALLPVMLPNKHGDFVDGEKAWMPALKIEFVNNEEQDKDLTAKEPTASAVPVEKWKLCWKKPDGHYGASSVSALCGIAEEFRKNKDNFSAVFIFENGSSASFGGVSLDGKKYQGLWKDKLHSGEFFIDFLSEGSAIGHFVDKTGPVKVSFIATKI